MRRVHVIVSGEVQGVGYRYTMQSVAERAGATGWVRNLRDGTVEAEIQGSDAEVQVVIDWAHRGPRGGRVDDVRVTTSTPDASAAAFEVRRDG